MNKFINSFMENREKPPVSNLLIRYNQIRISKKDKIICFIEGNSDKPFYSNLEQYEILKNVEYINMLSEQEGASKDEIGKDGVIKIYQIIKERYSENLNKCIFIVDRDYEGVWSSTYELTEDEKRCFSVTNPYAFENYFVEKENLKRIFKFFNVYSYFEEFNKKLEDFVKEIDTYNRLKSTTYIVCKKGSKYKCNLMRSSIHKANEIFIFDFNGMYKYYYRINLMNEEIESMKRAVFSEEIAIEYYIKESLKFSGKRDFVRGHDIYSFLQKYFWQKFNIDLRPKSNNRNYINMIKILNVNLNIVNGLGEKMINARN